jgi:hypothetical protein
MGKCYTRSGKYLRRFIGRSRLRAEYDNLHFFAACGIPTAPIVAFGVERKFGIFKRGYLITDEIQHTQDLAELAAANYPRLHNRHWVRCVSKQIASHKEYTGKRRIDLRDKALIKRAVHFFDNRD